MTSGCFLLYCIPGGIQGRGMIFPGFIRMQGLRFGFENGFNRKLNLYVNEDDNMGH